MRHLKQSVTSRPLTLSQANSFIQSHHRHHKPVQGHRFSFGIINSNGTLVGVCIVGRPVARGCDPYLTAEVTRLCTDGSKNACSFAYSKAARICRELGFTKIQTYILESEPAISLKAAGWSLEAVTEGGSWASSKAYAAQGRRSDQPQCAKQRWAKALD